MYNNKKWTVVWVYYFSSVYLADQLKSLYNLGAENFELLIINNSNNSTEILNIECGIAPYLSYSNITIINNNPPENISYRDKADFEKHIEIDQHGLALNLAVKNISTQYTLFYDLDFFWFQRNLFSYFEKYFKRGYRSVGAPYPQKVGYGKHDFPALYGAAHITEDLKNVDLMGGYNDEQKKTEALALYPKEMGYTFSVDVGYRLRQKMSNEKYVSFNQYVCLGFVRYFGAYGPSVPIAYFDGFKPIGIHLFGGNRMAEQTPMALELNDKELETLNSLWAEGRKKYACRLTELTQPQFFKFFICKNGIFLLFVRNTHILSKILKFIKKLPFGKMLIKYIKAVMRLR